MTVAINLRVFSKDHFERYSSFLHLTLTALFYAHPEHEFVLISNRKEDIPIILAMNKRVVTEGPSGSLPFMEKYWMNVKLPAILKQQCADILISLDGVCPLNTKLPQCLFVPDLFSDNQTQQVNKSGRLFQKNYSPKFLNKANHILTMFERSRTEIIEKYAIDPDKVTLIPPSVWDDCSHFGEEEKEKLKEQLTNGKEYFLYYGPVTSEDNLIGLLKAFSIFKRKLSSNFNLIIAAQQADGYEELEKKIDTFKYKEDVRLIPHTKAHQFSEILQAAYCFIYPAMQNGFAITVLEAMRHGVATIISRGSIMEEIIKDASLYVDPADHSDIAEKMMLLYKDESLRKRISDKAKTFGEQYKADDSADVLWDCILKTVTGSAGIGT